MDKVEIIKASGERDTFKTEKLIGSLRKAGASKVIANDIAIKIKGLLFEGITTKEIYKRAFSQLSKYSRPTAARYKLKKAIMELGETGYPFEKFVAALINSEGYRTKVGVNVEGQCVSHEIDVIAQNNSHHFMCECKFHNTQGRKCDVKIPLYIQSRFKDVKQTWLKYSGHQNKFHQAWLFTNTRFTSDAIKYGECVGMKLISWDYPLNDGIKDRIDRSGIHPITCLTTLTNREKKALIGLDKILCLDLCESPLLLQKIQIKKSRHKKILEEASALCRIN